jgi:hypothetical protein
MLPPFDDNGHLPPGIHHCTMEEVAERFGHGSPEREVEIKELLLFFEWARRSGARRLIVNGSFVTDKVEPNDVDLVLLPDPDQPSAGQEEVLWPFLQILVAADEADLEAWARQDFATDRQGRPKGVVEVIL